MDKEKRITLTICGVTNYSALEGLTLSELEMIKQISEVAILRAKGEKDAAHKLIEKQIAERIEKRSTI